MSISRPDAFGLQVRVKRNGKLHSKYFGYRAHGGRRAAMAAAKAHEARLLRLPQRIATAATKRNRTTGLRGIALTKYRGTGKGITVFEYKVGYRDPQTGRRRVKTFYVGTQTTRTRQRAAAVLRRAIAFRRKAMRGALASRFSIRPVEV